MARATKQPEPAAEPVTFDEIAKRRTRERLEAYRELVRRHADGETMTVEQMEKVLELLDQLGLPQYAHERDVQAMQRFKMAHEKYRAAVEAQPAHAIRATELAAEVEATQKKLVALREELHLANAKRNKPAAYGQTIKQMESEHPHVLAPLDLAVRLRTEELDRRKRATVGGAA
jgi:hypothetical protein